MIATAAYNGAKENNLAQFTHLQNVVEANKPHKVVYFDFDGIFSPTMTYDATGKIAKTLAHSARYAIEMLRFYGFEVNVITGDASGVGVDMTRKMLERMPISNLFTCPGDEKHSFIKSRNEDMSKVFYVGDDLFDIAMDDCILMTTLNAHPELRRSANYVALANSYDYAVLEIASAIVNAFNDVLTRRYAYKSKFDLNVDIDYDIENFIVLTENSSAFVDTWSPLLERVYEIEPTALNSAFSLMSHRVANDAKIPNKTIYLATDAELFAKHIDMSNVDGYAYLLFGDEHSTFENLVEIGNTVRQLFDVKTDYDVRIISTYSIFKITLLTAHLNKDVLNQYIEHCRMHNLQDILAIMDVRKSPEVSLS